MRRFSYLVAALSAIPAFSHDVITTNLTWNNEISRLVYRHCASCHHPGGSAMSLLTYEDARPWAKAIRNEVLKRRMPPFDAVKGVGEFRDDPSLSPPEMDLVVSWVEGGAPEGDPSAPPPKPVWRETRALPPSKARGLRVSHSLVLARPITLYGIVPEGALEVTACLPDQTVRRLIWIRDFRPRWNRAYVFRAPLPLPKGTRIMVYSASGAAAQLLTTRPPAP